MAGRQLPKQQSSVSVLPLNDPKCQESIKLLLDICKSSYGPSGQTKMIHNCQGGHVTITSTSNRLFKVTSISKPILKLVAAAVQGHTENYLDQGLFCATLCLSLLQSYLKEGIHRILIYHTLHALLQECLTYLSGDECHCKFQVNLSSVNDFVKLTKSILSSKPLCQFSQETLTSTSKKIVELFLSTVNFSEGNVSSHNLPNHGVMYITLEGLPVEESRILDGLLFETPQIPVYTKKSISPLRVQSGQHRDHIKVIVVDVSLSGDSDMLPGVNIEVTGDISQKKAMFGHLENLAQLVVESKVGVLACQKVVHPEIRHTLESHGVLVLQRLGSLYIDHFSVLTGATKWSSVQHLPNESHIGFLSSVRHCVYGGRSFLHLEGIQTGLVSTALLCNRTEEAVEETKVVFQSAVHALHLSLSEPHCLYGAGCWQTHLAQYITDKLEEAHSEWEKELHTNESTLRRIVGVFAQCLKQTALQLNPSAVHLTDSDCRHHWLFPTNTFPGSDAPDSSLHGVKSCACGAVALKDDQKFTHMHKEVGQNVQGSNEGQGANIGKEVQAERAEIIDCYSSAVNALQVAVSTAAAVLSLANVIQQK